MCCRRSGWAGDPGCRCLGPAGGGTPASAGGPAEERAETGAAIARWSPARSWSLKEGRGRKEVTGNVPGDEIKVGQS